MNRPMAQRQRCFLDDISSDGEAQQQPVAGEGRADEAEASAEPDAAPAARCHGGWKYCTAAQRKLWSARLHVKKANLKTKHARCEEGQKIVQLVRTMRFKGRQVAMLRQKVTRNVQRGLQLVSVARGVKRIRTIEMQDAVDIAYNSRKSRDVAAEYRICHQWVNTLRCFVAQCYFSAQLVFLGTLVSMCRARCPLACATRTAWDETGEKVTLSFPGATAAQQTSTHQVLVARVTLLLCWENGELFTFTIVFPTLLVLSVKASDLYKALFRNPMCVSIWAALTMIYSLSAFVIDLNETDGAKSNDKLYAYLLGNRCAQAHMLHVRCSLHQNQLVEGELLITVARNLLSRLYSLTLFLRTGGYFLRLIKWVPRVVEEKHVIKPVAVFGPPGEDARAYAREIIKYMIAHYKKFERSTKDTAQHMSDTEDEDQDSDAELVPGSAPCRRQNKGRSTFLAQLRIFFQIFNGELWGNASFIHYCFGVGCACGGKAPEAMVNNLRKVMFKAMPNTPAINKWTALGPVLDFLLFGCVVHMAFVSTFLKLALGMKERDMGDVRGLDMDFVKDMSFSAVAGNRFRTSRGFLSNPEHLSVIVMFALVLEPLRHMTSWFLRRCREVDHPCRCPSMDFMNPEYSPVVTSLQYISKMLFVNADRLMILWRMDGCKSFEELTTLTGGDEGMENR